MLTSFLRNVNQANGIDHFLLFVFLAPGHFFHKSKLLIYLAHEVNNSA